MSMALPSVPRYVNLVCRKCKTVTLHYQEMKLQFGQVSPDSHCLDCRRVTVDVIGNVPDHRLVINGKIVSKRKE
jgi:hypothetical protein